MTISIVYWSGTGNTETMAEAMAEGITEAGLQARLIPVGEADPDLLAKTTAFALGCPSMGAEELEESEMEPFVQSIEGKIAGKKIVLFGSYGWGDGEWMRNWEKRMKDAGAELINGAGIIVNEAPDEVAIAELKAVGKELAALTETEK